MAWLVVRTGALSWLDDSSGFFGNLRGSAGHFLGMWLLLGLIQRNSLVWNGISSRLTWNSSPVYEIAKLVYNFNTYGFQALITMVTGVYKPTNITGWAPHCTYQVGWTWSDEAPHIQGIGFIEWHRCPSRCLMCTRCFIHIWWVGLRWWNNHGPRRNIIQPSTISIIKMTIMIKSIMFLSCLIKRVVQ